MLRICAERKVPVTPRGAGSRHGAAARCRSQAASCCRPSACRQIKEIDAGDLVAVVEPGVVTGRLQEAVEAQGLFYPPDPASLEFCSIGGNASTNAGGPRAFKYGVTREYVLGLEVALMGGEVLRCGRRTAKGVTGYDLVAGFVGTEGTFGVITELTLKLLPKPPAAATVLGVFADVAAAAPRSRAAPRGLRPRVRRCCVPRLGWSARKLTYLSLPKAAGLNAFIADGTDATGKQAQSHPSPQGVSHNRQRISPNLSEWNRFGS